MNVQFNSTLCTDPFVSARLEVITIALLCILNRKEMTGGS